ncbi:MAG: hypothetical protein JXB10_19360 [Pirellulales bacterium]|nr:hypothetical protein [Pirellulales bacterium]
MNKAFIREPDQSVDYCPRCGSKGQPVGHETIRSYLPEGKRPPLADPANFCPTPQCDVVYFDSFGQFLLTGDLTKPVYPKDPDAPLCACFGLTRQDVERDVREGVVTRVRVIIEKSKTAAAHCTQLAANGQSCVAYIQKYYLQCKNAADSKH